MLYKLRARMQDEKGFTLIELLVVILIIGILAAIALPAFLNQRGKAQDSAAKSDVRTAQTAMETYYTDNQKYTGATKAALVAIEPALNDVNGLDVGTPTDTGYKIVVSSKAGGTFSITRTATEIKRECSDTGKGGCPSDGKW